MGRSGRVRCAGGNDYGPGEILTMKPKTMKQEDRAVISAMIVEMCREMFAPNGESFAELGEQAVDAERDGLLAASIGLSGQSVRGAMVVVARPAFFFSTYPVELGSPGTSEVFDWAGEVANQLLGRLKNRLGRYGVDFSLSTPTVVRGDRLRLRTGDQAHTIRRPLGIREERVDIHFEIEREDDQPLLSNGPPASASPEGDALLF
jgi:chemotaxis protein CheX